MHLPIALLLVGGGLFGVAFGADCPQLDYVLSTSGTGVQYCCPNVNGGTMVNMVCGAVTVKNGMTGRSCDATFQTSQRFGYVNFVSRAGFTVFASGQSRAGGDSINGGKGGLGARVSAKYVYPENTSRSTQLGYYIPDPSRILVEGNSQIEDRSGTRGGGTGGFIYGGSGTNDQNPARVILGGGGGAGNGPSPASDGKPANTILTSTCPGWNYGGDVDRNAMGGAGGGGCYSSSYQGAAAGSSNGVGGEGGTSGVYQVSGSVSEVTQSDVVVTAATSRGGSASFFFQCYPGPETTTTLTEYVPSSTSTSTATRFTSTETSTPATSITSTTLRVESVQPLVTVKATSTPAVSSFTEFVDSTTTPPTSFAYSTVTPAVSLFTETATETISPATRTVSSTYTPPTSFFAETVSETFTPALVVVPTTVTPATVTITETVKLTTTPPTSTRTAVSTSSTGGANCVQFRLVFPAACCPNTYLDMVKAPRNRRDIAPRALSIQQITSGIASTVVTKDEVTTTAATTPLSTSVIVEYFAGPLTTVTVTETAAAPSETTTATRFAEAITPTSTLVDTLAAASSTKTLLETLRLETPIFSDISTASAPSSTSTQTLSFTAETPTSIRTETAPAPLATAEVTEYNQAATPVTTTSTTAYARSTSCKLELAHEQKKCASGPLKVAERITVIALIKGKKLFGGKPVIVDCGSAGVFSY